MNVRCARCGGVHPRGRKCRRFVYPYAEKQRMAAAVYAHRRVHGDWCPGFRVPAHASADLTADHVVNRNRGGIGGPLRVLCRACNARRKGSDDME